MSEIIDQFITQVEQAITETAREYDDGIPYDEAADAPRGERVNRACDALLDQATIIMDDTLRRPNGAPVRHSFRINVSDGGSAYAMITWGEDQLDFWPQGKPTDNRRKGRIVWQPWGQAGMTLFDRMEQAIKPAAASH